jgi:hypothetical protein
MQIQTVIVYHNPQDLLSPKHNYPDHDIHLFVKLRSQLDITIQSVHCTGPAFFKYFVPPDNSFAEEAETCSIK